MPLDTHGARAVMTKPASQPGRYLEGDSALQTRLDTELEEIASQQHALTRRRAILRDLATRLRLGTPAVVILAHLEAAR